MSDETIPTAPAWPGGLTLRETEVADLLVRGYHCDEIATMCGVALKTADTHRAHVLAKTERRDVVALTRLAIRLGLVSPSEGADAPVCKKRWGR